MKTRNERLIVLSLLSPSRRGMPKYPVLFHLGIAIEPPNLVVHHHSQTINLPFLEYLQLWIIWVKTRHLNDWMVNTVVPKVFNLGHAHNQGFLMFHELAAFRNRWFRGTTISIHLKGLSLKLSRRLRRMSLTAKGAFALTFLSKIPFAVAFAFFSSRHVLAAVGILISVLVRS